MPSLARFGRDRRRSGGAGFSPLSLSPSVWYDAQTITPQANGSALTTWSDLSGNANTATQATVGDRPTYRTSAVGGKPAVRFDGAAQALDLTNTLSIGPCSLFAALVYNGTPNSYQPIITLPKLYFLASLNSGAWGCYMGANITSGVTLAGSTRYVLSLVVRAVNDVDLVTNGSLVNRTTGTSYNNKPGTNIAQSVEDSFFTAMDLGELLAIPSAVTVAQRQAVEAYMTARW